METPRDKMRRLVRRQAVRQAYEAYAVLVLEHERLRRTRWRGELGALWRPDRAAWSLLRFLASVHNAALRSTQALLNFFEAHVVPPSRLQGPDGQAGCLPHSVPWQRWREALRAGIDLVADVLVLRGAELPWGRSRPRVPRNREDFDAVCRFLRDLPPDEDRPPLSELIETTALPPLPQKERAPGHRATFYRGRQVLSIDGTSIALPMGKELAFLEILAERRERGEATPTNEHGANWRAAADNLRRRIRRMTGESLFHCVVLSARGPVGGYRLAPGVRVRLD